MKILTLGCGAFGFAMNKILGENNPNQDFSIFEVNNEIIESIHTTRQHPYFFKGFFLPSNVDVIGNYEDIIGDIDLLILALPAQFILGALEGLDTKLKSGVTFLNLAKGIDITKNKTISQLVSEQFEGCEYNYAVLSGGMIAQDVVEGKEMSGDLGIKDFEIGKKIQKLFQNNHFIVKLRRDIVNIELYGSLKNIMAIIVGYQEGKGNDASTVGYHMVEFYNEMKNIIKLYGGSENMDFGYYSLGGDMIATCFGNSRNRYFGRLLGAGLSTSKVLEKLKNENKHAEGYETLKAVYEKVKKREGFDVVKGVYQIVYVK